MVAHKALVYAESLGFQQVYQEALHAHQKLDDVYTDLDNAQDEIRLATSVLADREMQLLVKLQGEHPDWSATKIDQQMRLAKHQDAKYQTVTRSLVLARTRLSGVEIDRDVLLHTIRIREARMIELGGYFNYLAAVKQAETNEATRPREQETK